MTFKYGNQCRSYFLYSSSLFIICFWYVKILSAFNIIDCSVSLFQLLLLRITTVHCKKGKEIFLIYKEIQMGDRLQNHNEEVEEMRKYLVIYEEAVSHI